MQEPLTWAINVVGEKKSQFLINISLILEVVQNRAIIRMVEQ